MSKIDPKKWSGLVNKKMSSLENKIADKSEKVLQKLRRQEEKIWTKKLKGEDSLLANEKLKEIKEKYGRINEQLQNNSINSTAKQYIPHLDSLTLSLKLLETNEAGSRIKDAIANAENLQNKFTQAENIKAFIAERKRQLRAELEKLGQLKQFRQFQKTAYYYGAQIKEYKEILNHPKKVEKKALELLSKTKLFKDFFRKNSQLASLFRLPGDPSDPLGGANLAGLQTRVQVNSLIQQQIAVGGSGAAQQVRQNLQSAQSQLAQLKDKVLKAGGNNSNDDLPDFKPNSQKTKGFLKRLEYGTNIQTQKATNYFPITSDIGFSVGYKLNDKSVIGIGASYKMGFGSGWRNLTITHQGLGIRSYIDVKLKGSLWLSGGYEQNYRSAFNSIDQLQNLNAWQRSGLIGLSKSLPLKTKFFKKTKLQLLWDFLSYEQTPQAQPIIFRIGYSF